MTRSWRQMREHVTRIFPERQIYHRTEGRVSYISLSTRMQLCLAGGAAALSVWVLAGTGAMILSGFSAHKIERAVDYKIAQYERMLEEAQAREVSARSQLQNRTTEYRDLAENLERRTDMLRKLVEQSDPSALADSAQGRIMMASASGDAEPRESRLVPQDGARRAYASDSLGGRFWQIEEEQKRLIALAETTTQRRAETLRDAVEMTGLSLSELTGESTAQRGGPYVSVETTELFEGDSPAFNKRVARVAARVAEVEEMELALTAAPLGQPVDGKTRLTSSFGARSDPFTHSTAYHTGLDMAGYHRAPIMATAAGTVSYSGWKGGYGRVVEIDHGRGFKTRYAHLSEILVEEGQEVELGDHIAAMGSTGRSSGTHLHYEVWFRGKVYDPTNFLKAGKYVQQS